MVDTSKYTVVFDGNESKRFISKRAATAADMETIMDILSENEVNADDVSDILPYINRCEFGYNLFIEAEDKGEGLELSI